MSSEVDYDRVKTIVLTEKYSSISFSFSVYWLTADVDKRLKYNHDKQDGPYKTSTRGYIDGSQILQRLRLRGWK